MSEYEGWLIVTFKLDLGELMEKETNKGITEPQTLRVFKEQFPGVWESYRELRDSCDGAGPPG